MAFHNFLIRFAPAVWTLALILDTYNGNYNSALLEFIILTYALKELADLKIKELTDEISKTI